ncbi:MAG: LysR family transcriptional regulator [Phycicoccus sp.]
MRIAPERLLILRAVSDAGGVVAAGQRLHLAPSGVSQHLAALERETGLVLVDRSRRGGQRPASLTLAGHRLAEYGARLAELLDEAQSEAHALSGKVDGPIALAVFPTVIRPLVAPALAALAMRHPGVRPAVHEVAEEPALVRLHAGTVDVVLVEDDAGGPVPERRGRARDGTAHHPLIDDPYRLVMPATWPTPRSLSDVAERPWVDGPAGSAVNRVLARMRVSTGLPLVGAHTCLEFPATLALVSAGLAAALVPELALPSGPPDGVTVIDLSRLGGPPALGARRISAVYRVLRREPSPVVVALLEQLTAAARLSTSVARPTGS